MLIVAHRGASAKGPENTMPAFEQALADGADGVEFDVRLAKDGALVLMHDDETERTTGVEGRISAMTLTEIASLNAGARWPGADVRVPTFEQVLELLAGKVRLYIEVKGAWTGEEYLPAAAVVDAIAPMIAGVPNMVVSSFDPDAVKHARAVLGNVPSGLASLEIVEADWTLRLAIESGFDECHVPEAQIDPALMDAAGAADKRVLGWTVNDAARAAHLASIGCDGVFTDDPGALRVALDQNR